MRSNNHRRPSRIGAERSYAQLQRGLVVITYAAAGGGN
jgi:hypothetical protein